MNVILVEDDSLMINMYEKAFKFAKHNVVQASNGEEALKKIRDPKVKYDVILLDLMMPKMNGFDVLKELQSDKKWRKAPIIVLSNLAQKNDIDEALRLGANMYIIKSEYPPQYIVQRAEELVASTK